MITGQLGSILGTELAATVGSALPYVGPLIGLATSLTYTWCRPVRSGLCSCTGLCGDGRCISGGALRLAGADREILDGKRLP